MMRLISISSYLVSTLMIKGVASASPEHHPRRKLGKISCGDTECYTPREVCNDGVCECTDSYTSTTLSGKNRCLADPWVQCESSICNSNRQECISGSCECLTGWTGDLCGEALNECTQDPSPCAFTGGYCVDKSPTDGGYQCGCMAGHLGTSLNEHGVGGCVQLNSGRDSICTGYQGCQANSHCEYIYGDEIITCPCDEDYTLVDGVCVDSFQTLTNWVQLTSDGFEGVGDGNWGNFVAPMTTTSNLGSHNSITKSGDYSARLRYKLDANKSAKLTTLDIAVSEYNYTKVEFSYYSISYEQGMNFFLEYNEDHNGGWQKVETFRFKDENGVGFDNKIWYDATAYYKLTAGTEIVRFRFRPEGDSNSDKIILDDITISAS